MTKPMYKTGRPIKSVAAFESSESEWFKWNGKTTHRAVLISLQYRTLKLAIMNDRLYEAERIKEDET